MIYMNNGKLFSIKKKGSSNACSNMDSFEDVVLGGMSQSQSAGWFWNTRRYEQSGSWRPSRRAIVRAEGRQDIESYRA